MAPHANTQRMPRSRSAITLIEVLIVMGILGVLAAVSIPAVMRAKETSRKIACGSQLKQIAIACESYTDVSTYFPSRFGGGWKRQLRPYLGVADEQEFVPLYGCPSDQQHAIGDHFHDSYAINDGFGIGYRNGINANVTNPISLGEVIDGMSATAAFSERLSLPSHAPHVVEWKHFPHLTNRGLQRIFVDHIDLDLYYDECQHHAGETLLNWYVASEYQHVMPPNHNSCQLFPSAENPAPRMHVVLTAASPHRGGTHTVFCDGHLDFISEDIDLHVWRAIGTRDGGEPQTAF